MQLAEPVIALDTNAPGHRTDTTLIRCLATILIVNSHLEAFYPRSWLAGDGMIGGTLFYVISGFSLVLSNTSRPRRFLAWYWRRVWRILPSLLIAGVVTHLIIQAGWRTWRPIDYATTLVWPTPYTFIADIIPFYAIFYWVMRARPARRIYPALLCLTVLAYALVYAIYLHSGPDSQLLGLPVRAWLAHIFCFMGMLLGGWMAQAAALIRTSFPTDLIVAIAIFIIYLAAKFTVSVLHRYTQFYFIENVACFALLYYLVKLAWSPEVDSFWRRSRIKASVVSFLGRLTLEIYLIHELFTMPRIAAIRFPLNLLALWAGTLPCAWILGLVADRIRSLIGQRRYGYLAPVAEPRVTPSPDIVSKAPGI